MREVVRAVVTKVSRADSALSMRVPAALAYLASRAGISKPVVYDHFSSRSALLLSLYEDFDHRHIADLRAAIAHTPPDLRQRIEAIATAHVACVVAQGSELSGVVAALVGTPDLESARQESERRYVDICRQAMRSAEAPRTSTRKQRSHS
ncbi:MULTISPECIES: TetR family transcriptional regulator [unclassified Streptomyces]|uniref:TetR/AcrR family transcriptional regulator n=1 Tax=unclassified Streptomyces TaxID=2593676 RepID=UPI001319C16B|nr:MULTISPECIES: TetR family transcriptional regulator [unclassified Streptomyces]MYT33895.1 TetR family transcriptional regulator [Streptomyces sp. SID8354]